MIVIAHNIRSLYNVGSIFRNAAGFGVFKLYLTGYTGVPPRKEISKVALGAERFQDWEEGEVFGVIDRLKKEGYRVVGLEQGEGAVDLDGFEVGDGKVAVVLGNEVEGIDEGVIEVLDGLVEIGMDKKKSLNVAVASGVMMHVLMGKIRRKSHAAYGTM